MPTKYTVRVASPVQYEYWEATSDTYEEMLSAEQELRELKQTTTNGGDPQQERAIQNLNNGGLRTSLPGLSGGQAKPAALGGGLGGNRGQQAQQGGRDEIELGKLDDGTVITVHPTGKYGPYVKAYVPSTKDKHFANLPKGASPEQIDLATAVGLIEQKMAA